MGNLSSLYFILSGSSSHLLFAMASQVPEDFSFLSSSDTSGSSGPTVGPPGGGEPAGGGPVMGTAYVHTNTADDNSENKKNYHETKHRSKSIFIGTAQIQNS